MENDNNHRLVRRFEGMEVLADLLSASGCELTAEEVVEEFHCAIEEGSLAHEIIPLLWELEPSFPNTATAQRVFSNLFGLFEQIAEDNVADLVTLPDLDPDAPLAPARVDRAWREFDTLDDKSWHRARDRFENHQSEIGTFVFEKLNELDSTALTTAIILSFEMWWICESIRGRDSVRRASRDELEASWLDSEGTGEEREPALAVLASTALWEQAADEDSPISEEVIPTIEQALRAVRSVLAPSH